MIIVLVTIWNGVKIIAAIVAIAFLIKMLKRSKTSKMYSTPYSFWDIQKEIAKNLKELNGFEIESKHMVTFDKVIDDIYEVALVKLKNRSLGRQLFNNFQFKNQQKIAIAQILSMNFENDVFSEMTGEELYDFVDHLTEDFALDFKG